MHDITIKGTHAHSFVSSFVSFDDLAGQTTLVDSAGVAREFVALAMKYRAETGLDTNMGELAAFVSYAQVRLLFRPLFLSPSFDSFTADKFPFDCICIQSFAFHSSCQ